ncbi:hypothetical protein BsWGS_07626 [Bradybaena similaris]
MTNYNTWKYEFKTAQDLQANFFSNEEAELVMLILMVGITPMVSVIGIFGNFCSILVLSKQNWKKCSNILLLGLAISDITYLIAFNNVPKILYTVFGKESFPYPEIVSYVMFILLEISQIIDYSSGLTSLTLPMLITTERLITVFQPLQASTIITPLRTFLAVSGVFIFWYVNFTYTAFWYGLSDNFDKFRNRTVFVIVRSDLYEHDKTVMTLLEDYWTYASLRIPPLFTFIGCVVIGIKIKMASLQRIKLTGRKVTGGMNRTTKTLLAVCGMYTITCVIMLLPYFMPQYASYSVSEEASSNVRQITYQIINIVLCINSSCNFVIYIVFNKNFRDAYKALFIKDYKKKAIRH